jgi:SAM-dependent methyltransferase
LSRQPDDGAAGGPGSVRSQFRTPGDWAEQVSASLEVSPELLPHIPELLQDLSSLGCTLEPLVRLARVAGLGPPARVLDLCCGKGAASVALASELGCTVVGVDLFPPFLQEALMAAKKAGVGHLCTFVAADARVFLGGEGEIREEAGPADIVTCDVHSGGSMEPAAGPGVFDAVVMAAAGAVLGGYGETVGRLRRVIRPGGWMILEEGYLPAGFSGTLPPGYEHCLPREEALTALTSHGDQLAEELVVPRPVVAAFNRATTDLIRDRAEGVAAVHPEVAEGVRAYALEQEMWSAAAESVETVVWLLRRDA